LAAVAQGCPRLKASDSAARNRAERRRAINMTGGERRGAPPRYMCGPQDSQHFLSICLGRSQVFVYNRSQDTEGFRNCDEQVDVFKSGSSAMKKNVLNYWVDVGIGVSFVLSAASGLVFLLPAGSSSGSGILGAGYLVWNQLHTWSSLGLMAGALAHLVLHWKWIAGMTRKMLPFGGNVQEDTPSAPGLKVSRRRFLSLGFVAAATGVIAAGCALIARAWPIGTEQGGSSDEPSGNESGQPVQQRDGVACPRGVVNDPYPGRCRRYTDGNGDGICDYSVTGSGYN
jgi:hypothetical protein